MKGSTKKTTQTTEKKPITKTATTKDVTKTTGTTKTTTPSTKTTTTKNETPVEKTITKKVTLKDDEQNNVNVDDKSSPKKSLHSRQQSNAEIKLNKESSVKNINKTNVTKGSTTTKTNTSGSPTKEKQIDSPIKNNLDSNNSLVITLEKELSSSKGSFVISETDITTTDNNLTSNDDLLKGALAAKEQEISQLKKNLSEKKQLQDQLINLKNENENIKRKYEDTDGMLTTCMDQLEDSSKSLKNIAKE
jgi:hypothetical protein